MTNGRKAFTDVSSGGPRNGRSRALVFHGNPDYLDNRRRPARARNMKAMRRLTGGLAHNLNNLLQIIQTDVEMARHHVAQDDLAREYLDHALAAVQRGAQLGGQLLAFSCRQFFRPRPVDANQLVEQSIDSFSHALGEGIEIEAVLAANIPAILVDPSNLDRAITNILHNARAAMPAGGRLTVETGHTYMDRDCLVDDHVLPAGEYVEISVRDTGCGMSAETLAHAFEPFYTTRRVGEGIGLGLSVAYGFARQSGGLVTLESELDEGTIVRMLIPAGVSFRRVRSFLESPL